MLLLTLLPDTIFQSYHTLQSITFLDRIFPMVCNWWEQAFPQHSWDKTVNISNSSHAQSVAGLRVDTDWPKLSFHIQRDIRAWNCCLWSFSYHHQKANIPKMVTCGLCEERARRSTRGKLFVFQHFRLKSWVIAFKIIDRYSWGSSKTCIHNCVSGSFRWEERRRMYAQM